MLIAPYFPGGMRFVLTTPLVSRPYVHITAAVMEVLDSTIVNVALPHMQGSFAASQDQITWVLTSYIVAAAIMTPPTGWLSGDPVDQLLATHTLPLGSTCTAVTCCTAPLV